jgi:hypothetical protein
MRLYHTDYPCAARSFSLTGCSEVTASETTLRVFKLVILVDFHGGSTLLALEYIPYVLLVDVSLQN